MRLNMSPLVVGEQRKLQSATEQLHVIVMGALVPGGSKFVPKFACTISAPRFSVSLCISPHNLQTAATGINYLGYKIKKIMLKCQNKSSEHQTRDRFCGPERF